MINERKLSKSELNKREDIIMKMKGNKRDLVKKYGKDAEAVMYGRATNMAKKQTKEMRDPNLTELIKDALKNPKRADLNKDGKLSDYEEKRGAAIEKSMDKEKVDEVELPMSIIQKLANEIKDPQGFAKAMLGIFDAIQDKEQKDYSKNQKFGRVLSYLKDIADSEAEEINEAPGTTLDLSQDDMDKLHQSGKLELDGHKLLYKVKEDIDLGHEDNEPGMLKAELYHIGSYAMELYKMMDDLEGMGEIDFPAWWQSKITTAKNNISGAKHYLEFELKEPKIDAVVDVATDVVDEEIGQLGTDGDTGFQASLYTPNELGDASVGREYASGAFEESKKPIEEAMNMNKWRRAYNGKAFAKKTVYLTDYNNNKKRYTIYFKYKETPSKDVVSLKESHYGNHEGSGMAFAMSNLQNKPVYQFTSDDKFEWDNEEEFDAWVAEGPKGLESLLSFFLGGRNVDDAIKSWFDTGVTDKSKLKIGPAEYYPDAAVNESTSKHSSIAEKLAKELKEGLPKGFWDKKIDAKDEDQDGKIDEDLKGLMAQGEKIAAFANKQSGYEGGVSSPVRGVLAAMAAAGAPDFDGDDEMVSYYTRKLTKAIETQKGKKYMSGFSIDESYDTLVNKIKKQGKSSKAAKAIAGAVASYKAKGGGKGPTAKQK